MRLGRLGIAGTGDWVARVHGPAARDSADWELVSLWGRDPGRAASAAAALGCASTSDWDAFLDGVDAVQFAVPPSVQAPRALEAARRGKHLLLEKPLALAVAEADALAAAVVENDVACNVFFTRLWNPTVRGWLDGLRGQRWESGACTHLAALPAGFLEGAPWRVEHGALWDIGPHALSVLERVLGRVVAVSVEQGARDLVRLLLRHESGALGTAELSLTTPAPAALTTSEFWGPAGRVTQPTVIDSQVVALGAALSHLAEQVRSGSRETHAGAAYGAHVTRVLAAAERSLTEGRQELTV